MAVVQDREAEPPLLAPYPQANLGVLVAAPVGWALPLPLLAIAAALAYRRHAATRISGQHPWHWDHE